MNAGGDQGRDDYGLPPVDIEVPDDARELARDVQAYHRELRSRRRRSLARRVYGPITRDGMVLPLLAGCLALTLVAATLLTVFTARQPTAGLRPQRPAAGTSSQAPARPGPALVQTILFAAGRPTPLNTLPAQVVVLALIPPRCDCLRDLQKLANAALAARTLIYLVGLHNTSVTAFATDLGLGPSQGLEDTHNLLPSPYRVATLTAVVVRPDGSADPRVIPDRGHGFQLENDVRALATGSAASPARLVPASGSPAAASGSGSPGGQRLAGRERHATWVSPAGAAVTAAVPSRYSFPRRRRARSSRRRAPSDPQQARPSVAARPRGGSRRGADPRHRWL